MSGRRARNWLAAVAIALGLALAARCARDVQLGTDPRTDGGSSDGAAG
jgi:hypothetical protein